MSQAGTLGNGGGGGGGDVNSLTPDVGAAVTAIGGTIPALGYQADTVQTVRTYNDGAGNFRIADQTWETQYVVDASTTNGLRGTFTTIQAALTQAVADGMTLNSPRKIFIRPGTYTQNLTIPGGAFFQASTIDANPSGFFPTTIIEGNHTLEDVCEFYSDGIQWNTTTGDMFTSGTTFCIFAAKNSIFNNTGAGQILLSTAGSTFLWWEDNQFLSSTSFVSTITISSLSNNWVKNCNFNNVGWAVASGTLRMSNCRDVGEINLTPSAVIIASDTNFAGDTNSNIYGTNSTIRLYNCSFTNNDGTKYAVDSTSNAVIINGSLPQNSSVPVDFVSPTTTPMAGFVTVGNVLKAIRSNTDVVSSSPENYVGITDTTNPVAVTINIGPVDYQIYVVDESGGAGTNNITVTDGTGALINGAASYVIASNYGGALFHTDGTEWFVTTNTPALTALQFTEDSGVATVSANNVNVLGQKANITPVVSTTGTASTISVEDRTWKTQYVVDASTTNGLRGTFTTIQSAINQAVADGVTAARIKTIFIRPGAYTEDLVMPANSIHLIAHTPSGFLINQGSTLFDVTISGNMTFATGAAAHFTNLNFSSAAGTTISATNTTNAISFVRCNFNTGGTNAISVTAASSAFTLDHCTVIGGTINATAGSCEILDSNIISLTTGSSIDINMYDTMISGLITLAGTSRVNLYRCLYKGTGNYLSIGTGCTANAWDNIVETNATTPISGAGTFNHAGTVFTTASSLGITATTQSVRSYLACIPRTAVAASPFTAATTDYFLSVDTTSARTIRLPNAAATNQVFIVKDRTGGALLNNITVTTPGGVVTIDGSTSYTIATNFGSAQFLFNGTSYEVF